MHLIAAYMCFPDSELVCKQNHHKCLATGAQFIDPKQRQNHLVCTGMSRINSGTNQSVAATLETNSKRAFRMPVRKVAHSRISDEAAAGVAALFEQEKNVCLMHRNDKIARSALGDLVRKSGGKEVNPFPAGRDLVRKVHDAAVHFSYSSRFDTMMEKADAVLQKDSFPRIRPKVDKNTTRVMARHGLFVSTIRMNKPLQLYATSLSGQKHDKGAKHPFVALSDTEWKSTTEAEAVMNVTQAVSKLSQTEKKFTAAFGYAMKKTAMAKLRATKMSVVKLAEVNSKPSLPREDVDVSTFTDVGKETLRRAALEAERRFCGNRTEELQYGDVEMSLADQLSALLDPRTCSLSHIADREMKGKMVDLLKEEYVRFGKCALAFLDSKAKAARAQLAALNDGADGKAPINVDEVARETGSQGSKDGGSDVEMEEEQEEEFADEDFWDDVLGAGPVEPAAAKIPEAQKTAVQLREEEEARDKEETARLEQEFYRVLCAYRRKASTIEWKEHKVCYARLCLYVRMNLNA